MTTREFLQAVIDSEGVAVNVKEFASEQIVKLDERNAKRTSKPTKTQIANETVKTQIMEVLSSEPKVASVIAELVGISTQKASALCLQLAADEKIRKVGVKVPKKGTQLGYSLQPTEEVE